ncbi:spinster family MFS transporter [Telluribacter humicola]|uniref:spinster family MFS transporter n=1 Tax=Telluribacter humicola TaxID=1720261 RepID=UPI001A95FB9A|nr:MFS transporter [Telluribacter humicola]
MKQTLELPLEQAQEPSLKYGWYVVFLLTLANISSFIDRQILSLLVVPIKRDLGLTDFKMSLLMGLSFALFYTLFGVIIGRLADRYSRRNIIMSGVALWSLMTVLCGGIRSYSQFFLARMGVGVGEATLSPSAYSMIADYFPKSRLATALSIFSSGIFLGSGIALLIGAGIIATLPTEGRVYVPLLGSLYPWQLLFVYIGLPGLILSALMLTVKEPVRKNLLKNEGKTVEVSIPEALKIIFKHKWAYLSICFGLAFSALINYGCSALVPTFLVRTYGWSMPHAGLGFGIVLVVASGLGVLWGGWYADRLVRMGHTDGRLRVGLISLIAVTLTCFAPLLDSPILALAILFIPCFFLASNIGAAASAVQELMPNQVRVLASAIFLFILNLIGLGLGPTTVAIFTDFVFQDEGAIRYSLALLLLIGGVVGGVSFWTGLKPYREAIENNKGQLTDEN